MSITFTLPIMLQLLQFYLFDLPRFQISFFLNETLNLNVKIYLIC